MDHFDVGIVGGGINGAAVARDAAGRGLKVFLAERDDYGHATSSASSKLIHGGLRYLEHYKFRLVRESLLERAVMLRIAPHLTRPLRFWLPINRHQPRPTWVYRAGLFLYQALASHARIESVGHVRVDKPRQSLPAGLRELCLDDVRSVLHYPDVQVDDSRLVIETLLDARARGASIQSRTEVTAIQAGTDGFILETRARGVRGQLHCRALVNAAGPWAEAVASQRDERNLGRSRLRLVRGSHIVVREPEHSAQCAYTLPLADGRVVFVMPWIEGLRIIGTTDVPHKECPDNVECSAEEESYLLEAYNRSFRARIKSGDIVGRWAGVRPLLDDGAASPSDVSRDYTLEVQRTGSAVAIDVYGGKLTTHRKLAEAVMDALRPLWRALPGAWTASLPLHGGQLSRKELEVLWERGPGILHGDIRRRWVNTYGSIASELFERVRRTPSLALEVAPGIALAELQHAVAVEDAFTADDFLQRRTKLCYSLDPSARALVAGWFREHSRFSDARCVA